MFDWENAISLHAMQGNRASSRGDITSYSSEWPSLKSLQITKAGKGVGKKKAHVLIFF